MELIRRIRKGEYPFNRTPVLRECFDADGPKGVPTSGKIKVVRHVGDQSSAPSGRGAAKTTEASILSPVVFVSDLNDFVERVSISSLLLTPGLDDHDAQPLPAQENSD